MYCKSCKRETAHYTDKKGNVRCCYCGTISVKAKKKLVFEPSEDFFKEEEKVQEATFDTSITEDKLPKTDLFEPVEGDLI